MTAESKYWELLNGENTVEIASTLIGSRLSFNSPEGLKSGIIVETEAYMGINDKASHSFGGRRTARTETMYAKAGTIYVYLCYGIHHLLNFVTNKQDIPQAVLIRGIIPEHGFNFNPKELITKGIGPGKVSKLLGISTTNNSEHLSNSPIQLAPTDFKINQSTIRQGPRIGVDYAGDDALLPYRFYLDKQGLIETALQVSQTIELGR